VHFGKEFLAPIQQFLHDGYNEMLFSNIDLSPNDNVLIIGGHVGVSAEIVFRNYRSNICIFEPIPDFCTILTEKFHSYSEFVLVEAAAASFDGFLELSVEGEKTGIGAEGPRISVPAIKLSHYIQNNFEKIGLLEINIEGGEYSVLPDLIETGQIRKVKVLLVQFHKFSLQDDLNRSLIHQSLSRTHRMIFSYEWIWERWELI
jgi:FkbM family methyltransferase